MILETIQMNKYCNDFHNGENIYFCKIDFILQEFSFLRHIGRDVILIVSSGDITFTENHLNHCPSNVKQIFATNTNIINDLVIPIPTGIENELTASREGHGIVNSEIFPKLKYLKSQDRKLINIFDKFYANFSVQSAGTHLNSIHRGYRNEIKKICEESNFIDFESGLDLDEYFKKVLSYKASISPTGNGIECVRTWELMYMDRVPIVVGGLNLHSPIYENIYKHLPLIFIENLELLTDKNFLMKKVDEAMTKPKDKLDYNYWKDFISEKIKEKKL